MRKLIFLTLFGVVGPALADVSTYMLAQLKGYTIVDVGDITGYVDKDGKKHDDFQGCNYGWKIILDYSKVLTCDEYNYEYDFQPKAIILAEGNSWKMLVGNHVYDMSN